MPVRTAAGIVSGGLDGEQVALESEDGGLKSFLISLGFSALIGLLLAATRWLINEARDSRMAAIACRVLGGILVAGMVGYAIMSAMAGEWGLLAWMIGIPAGIGLLLGVAWVVGQVRHRDKDCIGLDGEKECDGGGDGFDPQSSRGRL